MGCMNSDLGAEKRRSNQSTMDKKSNIVFAEIPHILENNNNGGIENEKVIKFTINLNYFQYIYYSYFFLNMFCRFSRIISMKL